jgi:hypothetical protein
MTFIIPWPVCYVLCGIFGTLLVEVLLVWATGGFRKGR